MSTDPLSVPGLPAPLHLINGGPAAEVTGEVLVVRAGAGTDWFIDPAGDGAVHDAPALVMPAAGPWTLRARVSAEHRATFDAAVLVVHVDERTWAKLCLELSPLGEVTVVSVVTRGESDDCNSFPVDEGGVHLRVSRLGRAFAFHYSSDGATWSLIRYFSLGVDAGTAVDVGFLAQSPTGEGCAAAFGEIEFTPARLEDVRSGA